MSGSITKIGASTKPRRGRIQVKIGDTGLQVPDMLRPSRRLWSTLLTVLMALPGISVKAGPLSEPNLSSLFPLGGRPGGQVQVTLRGEHLASARAVWFDSRGLDAEILSFEAKGEDKTGTEPSPESGADRLALRISIDPNVEPGERRLRVVTPGGLSNSLPFRVHREPTQMESESAHELPDGAQAWSLIPWPFMAGSLVWAKWTTTRSTRRRGRFCGSRSFPVRLWTRPSLSSKGPAAGSIPREPGESHSTTKTSSIRGRAPSRH